MNTAPLPAFAPVEKLLIETPIENIEAITTLEDDADDVRNVLKLEAGDVARVLHNVATDVSLKHLIQPLALYTSLCCVIVSGRTMAALAP